MEDVKFECDYRRLIKDILRLIFSEAVVAAALVILDVWYTSSPHQSNELSDILRKVSVGFFMLLLVWNGGWIYILLMSKSFRISNNHLILKPLYRKREIELDLSKIKKGIVKGSSKKNDYYLIQNGKIVLMEDRIRDVWLIIRVLKWRYFNDTIGLLSDGKNRIVLNGNYELFEENNGITFSEALLERLQNIYPMDTKG